MLFSIAVSHAPRYLQLTCLGDATVADWCGAFSLAGAVASRSGERRILIDMLAVNFELTPEERREIGCHGARVLSGFDRVASAIPGELYTGEAECAARSEGLTVRSFDALDPAAQWLLE